MLFVLAGLLFSCDEDVVDKSFITNVTPFNVTGPSLVMADETSEVVTITFTLDENQILDTEVRVVLDRDGSTAVEGEDFAFTDEVISIPAFGRSGSFDVEIFRDYDVEGSETARFVVMPVGPEDEVLWSIENDFAIELVISNEEGGDLRIAYDWGAVYDVVVEVTGTAAYGGPFDLITGADIVDGPQSLGGCSFADIDMLVINDEFTTIYGASARTSACPETVFLPEEGDITNGATPTTDSFYVLPEMYLNWGDSEFSSTPEAFLLTAYIAKRGTAVGVHVQDETIAFPTDFPGDFGSFAGLGAMHYIVRDNGVWTVYEDFTGTVVFNARAMNALEEIRNGTRVLHYEDGTEYVPKSYQ